MKKIMCILLNFAAFTFGQQALWYTVENDSLDSISIAVKYIKYKNVTNEVLEFYDLYKFYYDYTGYSKEVFIKEMLGKYLSDDTISDILNDVEKKTVLAVRVPIEGGSAIIVWCIDKNNCHMVIFSNVNNSDSNMTYNGEIENDRKRFEKWFRTLLE